MAKKRGTQRFPLGIVAGAIVVLSVTGILILVLEKKSPSRRWAEDEPSAATPPPPTLRRVVIPAGSTLADLLKERGFTDLDVESLKERARAVYDLNKIVAGREMRFSEDPQGRILAIEYDVDETNFLLLRRTAEGFEPSLVPIPYVTRLALIWGTIEDIPISAFNACGEKDVLAMDFAEIFAWDVDFYIDPRKGDAFRLVFEKRYREDTFVGYGNILAAEYVNQGKLLRAFRYVYSDTGKADYFDASAGSLRKEFMKSPLKYGRITSRFSSSRLHPIHRIYRSHYGVDYAAPVGTAVRATAAGTVVSAGWNGGAGRMVKIRHKGGYETVYMHLSGLAWGIAKNAEVESGQIIGYVGSTGESTGPHLDYRILHHGSYVNPQGHRFRPAEPLRTEFLEDFKRKVEAGLLALNLPLVYLRSAITPFVFPSPLPES